MAPSAINILEQYPTILEHTPKGVIRANGAEYQSRDGLALSKKLIREALKERVESIDVDTCEAGVEDTFFVADVGEVYRQHLRWKRNLGRVKPHYGMS